MALWSTAPSDPPDVPLVARGAGAVTRHAASTPVFGCTIAASQFGVFLIPLLYITAEHLRGRSQKTQKTK